MTSKNINDLVNKYINLSFSVYKSGEHLIQDHINSDLTNDQQYILRYINTAKSCTSTELAEVFLVKKSAITAIITRMWEKGLIQRTRDENDRRVVYLTLTEKGQELFNKTEEKIQMFVESFINKFDEEEITQFVKTYEKLDQILKQCTIECKNNKLEE